jgi:hypothetical protein
MNVRAKKILLLLLAAALLFGSSRMQQSLNRDRGRLGLVRVSVLQNAPPMLAFTTVALGGFRGLISNLLWIRANDLQQDDKFFEAAQLADWITDLEPHFPQVWLFQAWNMAYNISIKFKDFPDRWRWVERAIELLRDDGLRYNPDDVLIYRELAWFFQHKMGQNLDDANIYFKQQWALEMTPFFSPNGTNFDALLHPQTAAEKTNAFLLREKYKMDPEFAKKVNDEWGPLDWRLPEAHAIYWGAFGLAQAKLHPDKVNPDDLIKLRRNIYQSMLQAFHHGRIIRNPLNQAYELVPDLDLAAKVNDAYEKMYAEETSHDMRDGIQKAHRNFLGDAVYMLYEDNRVAEAADWYRYLARKYPDNNLLNGNPNSRASQMTFEQYAIARVQEDIGDTSQERTTAVVEGLLARAYYELASGQDDRYAAFKRMAGKIYENYQVQTADFQGANTRIVLPPFADLNRTVLNRLLDTQQGLPFAARAVLRTQLALPSETNAPPAAAGSTNAPGPAVAPATNAPASTGK